MSFRSSDGSDERFSIYVEGLASVVGHADRVNPLRDYCTGLMMPCARKSVEPMAAVTAPARTLPPGRAMRECQFSCVRAFHGGCHQRR